MKILLSALFCIATAFSHAGERKWTEHPDLKLVPGRFQDGDSFTLKAGGRGKPRTYRLYGVDCPESVGTDPVLEKQIAEQMDHFKLPRPEVLAWGKIAADFTGKLLNDDKVTVWTYGRDGEKAPGHEPRIYALVEVMAPDGKPRMLHELLLEAGLAGATSPPAPWPEKELKRLGEKKARESFKTKLKTKEHAADRNRVGIWKRPRP